MEGFRDNPKILGEDAKRLLDKIGKNNKKLPERSSVVEKLLKDIIKTLEDRKKNLEE